MNWVLLALIYSTAALACTGPSSSSSDSEQETQAADIKAVQCALEDIILADNAGDLVGVMAIYAEDAMLLPPNGANVSGHAEIQARYRQIFSTTKFCAWRTGRRSCTSQVIGPTFVA